MSKKLPKSKIKDKLITVRLNKSEYKLINSASKSENRTMSNYILTAAMKQAEK